MNRNVWLGLAIVSTVTEIATLVYVIKMANKLERESDSYYDDLAKRDPELAETMRNKFSR